ncbi:hypothetical protein EV194_104190 [Natronoflexus pectinivorans]|uniref:Uncharacterized protein n=1 Tax=Natronoflexus pectinivorans TaxID=682526 RepID=A0A4R2GJH0_9BACT|nr:hypothetical protein EV194_104190 [Natronoflexus pectinivorans]
MIEPIERINLNVNYDTYHTQNVKHQRTNLRNIINAVSCISITALINVEHIYQ